MSSRTPPESRKRNPNEAQPRAPQPTAAAPQPLNGLSVHTLTLNQDGDLEVQFDLPVEQTSFHYYQQLRGSRTLNVYDDPELKAACKSLFDIVRARLENPDPERTKVHCDRCATSACCRKYNALITDEDIDRLATALGISASAFRKSYTTLAVDWSEDFTAQLACDQDESGEEKCVFLKRSEGGQFRCSVYESRPRICRDFDMRSCSDFEELKSFVPLESLTRRN